MSKEETKKEVIEQILLNILEKIFSVILKMIKNNPFKTLPALSFIIGAIIILIYFIKINYFPSNMSINDIIIILSLSCILGLIFIFMITIILASPVFFYDLSEDLKKFEETINNKELSEIERKNKPRQVKALVLYIPLLILTILTVSSILVSDIFGINIIPLNTFLFILSFIIAIYIFKINFNLVHPKANLIKYFTTKITYTYMFFIFISLFLSFISITLSSFYYCRVSP
ncbi:hypothetical protein HOO31_04780 [Aliarcobacter cryaerophilus]|uniref:hypothetical protein n=1 Tax=Aliarcobacter cryaerophilus TaxID=28198 RepID=UPI00164BC54D|nr:hypothetical protein [Aliarcobacter cryaerophilus]QNK85925.1 hypothetical protein HOO31_04780 [Aliarcobacter cryaerophilus]